MGPMHAAVLLALKKVGQSLASTPLPEWDLFAGSTRMATFAPRTRIPADTSDVFVVIRGLVKMVRPASGDGKARIEEFVQGPGAVAPKARPSWAEKGALPPFLAFPVAQPWDLLDFELETIERTQVLRIDLRVVEELAHRHPAWGQAYTAFMWSYVVGLMHSIQARALVSNSVETRYRKFLENRRSLLRRVTQRDLASYFGVTESGLSRIAARVRDEGGTSDLAWEELDWADTRTLTHT